MNQEENIRDQRRPIYNNPSRLALPPPATRPVFNKGFNQNVNKKPSHSYISSASIPSKSQPQSAVSKPAVNMSTSLLSRDGGRGESGVALATAKLKVLGKGNKSQIVRVFFDLGAQASFVHPDLIEKLGLEATGKQEIFLKAFGNEKVPLTLDAVNLKIACGKLLIRIRTLITQKVDTEIYAEGLTKVASTLSNNGVKLADSYDSDLVDNIMVVVVADFLGHFMTGVSKVFGIHLIEIPVGHVIYGKVSEKCSDQNQVVSQNVVVARITVGDVKSSSNDIEISDNPDVTKLWDLETIGIEDEKTGMLSQDEKNVMVDFAKTISYSDSKYWVALPWKDDPSYLPSNYRVARGQLHSLISKLKADPVKYQQYDRIIRDYESQGFVELVEDESIKGHYLPHHCVEKQSSTTPIRIVFNASSKANQKTPCLNDMLETGPNLTNKLVDCLAQFRMRKYGVTADIAKAFLRVGLVERDRKYVQFLWVDSLDNERVVTYRFRSVMFGSTSSPFLLQATLYRHFMKSQSEYKDLLLNSFYVDNFLTTVDKEEELFQIHTEVNKCLEEAGMPLQLWNSNSKLFNEFVDEGSREVITNVLGLLWDTDKDTICLKPVRLNQVESLSKRRALSLISSVYDPLG